MARRTGSQRLDSTRALRLVIRWDRMVRLRHSQGKPPCNVADHILRYERAGAVCPCGNPLPSPLHGARDKERGACPRCSRQGSRGSRRDPDAVYTIRYRDKHSRVHTMPLRAKSREEAINIFRDITDEWPSGPMTIQGVTRR